MDKVKGFMNENPGIVAGAGVGGIIGSMIPVVARV